MIQSFYCVDCAVDNEKELMPISSQVYIFEGKSLCRKHFLVHACPSGLIPQSTLEKVARKRDEDLKAYEHWLRRVENEGTNDSLSY